MSKIGIYYLLNTAINVRFRFGAFWPRPRGCGIASCITVIIFTPTSLQRAVLCHEMSVLLLQFVRRVREVEFLISQAVKVSKRFLGTPWWLVIAAEQDQGLESVLINNRRPTILNSSHDRSGFSFPNLIRRPFCSSDQGSPLGVSLNGEGLRRVISVC